MYCSPGRVLSTVSIALILAASTTSAGVVAFLQHTVEGDLDGVRMVRAVDLDGDGDLDILAAADGTNVGEPPTYPNDKVTWFENSAGDGSTWIEHTVESEFAGANSVGAGDLDGDGDPDIFATAGVDGEVKWWANHSNAAAFLQEAVRTGVNGANWVEAGDVDGDGDLDLMGAAVTDKAIIWWENDGSPDVGTWPEYRLISSFEGAWSARPADMDHDGDLDIVTSAVFEDMIVWWENDGTPDDGWLPRIVTDTLDGAHGAFPADLDGDGDLDIVGVGLSGNTIAWWESDGTPADGGWTEHGVDASFTFAYDAGVGDVDGDGDLDILGAAFSDNDVAWWENDGTPEDGGWIKHTVSFDFLGVQSIDWADLDGDGDLDLLGAANVGDDVAWWENETVQRNLTFVPDLTRTIDSSFSGTVPGSIDIADIDRDGHPDVVAADPAGQDVVWWRSDGTPGDGGWVEHSVTGGTVVTPLSVVAEDVDGDGDLDIINSADDAPGLGWWENDGTPTDGGWTQHSIGTTFVHMRTVDIDRDGDPDIVGRPAGGGCYFYVNNVKSSGTWGLQTLESYGCGAAPPAIVDLDGDGDPDIVSSDANNWLTWWENDGPPWIPNPWTLHTIHETAVVGVGIADLDSDGDMDVLALQADTISWYENDGTPLDGGWVEHASLVSHGGAAAGTINGADLDSDGDVDILAAADTGNDVFLQRQTAMGTFQTYWPAGHFGGAMAALAHDMDGDGALDLVGAASTDDEIVWWRNGGGQFTLRTTDLSPRRVEDSTDACIFDIVMTHRGRTDDPNLELATLELLFETHSGVPLSGAQANALIANLMIFRDNGDTVCNTGIDPIVTTVGSLVLDAGVQTVTFADGDPDVEVELVQSKRFFVVIETTSDGISQDPNLIVMTHLTDPTTNSAVSSAEDLDHDIPLTMEWAADESTALIRIAGPLIFADGFESGDTAKWSTSVP